MVSIYSLHSSGNHRKSPSFRKCINKAKQGPNVIKLISYSIPLSPSCPSTHPNILFREDYRPTAVFLKGCSRCDPRPNQRHTKDLVAILRVPTRKAIKDIPRPNGRGSQSRRLGNSKHQFSALHISFCQTWGVLGTPSFDP